MADEIAAPITRKQTLTQTHAIREELFAPNANQRATKETGIALANLLEIEYVREKPRLRLTGQDERREEHARSTTHLELDCLYNDHLLTSFAFETCGVPFCATVMQCKKTKYGLCFLHCRIYQPLTGWLRWCTINARDFCKSLGFTTVAAFSSSRSQDPALNEPLGKFIIDAFTDDLTQFDFFLDMVTAHPFLQNSLWFRETSLRVTDKVMMVNTYSFTHAKEKEAQRNTITGRKKISKRISAKEDRDSQFQASAQEVVFVKCILTLDKDAVGDIKFVMEKSLDNSTAEQKRARRAMKKKKKETERALGLEET